MKTNISVVIPALNEEKLLETCLEAISKQTVKPYEVIVVDNGSDDRTFEIASSYPWVRVISEPKRGIFFARNAGFNAANGDLIARTDADSIPHPNWLKTISDYFGSFDASALTGQLEFFDVLGLKFITKIEARIRKKLIARPDLPKFLSGANMAIRRDAWQTLWQNTCPNEHIHEDVDLTIHLQNHGHKIAFVSNMKVLTSSRRMESSFREYYRYIKKVETTYNTHGIYGLNIKLPILLYVPGQPLIRIAARMYRIRKTGLRLQRIIYDLATARY